MFSITGVVNKQEIDDLLDAMAHIVYRKKWYDYVILSNLLIVICFPIGLYAIWRTERIALWWKVSSTVLVILIFSAIFGPYDSAEYTPPQYSEEQAHQVRFSDTKTRLIDIQAHVKTVITFCNHA